MMQVPQVTQERRKKQIYVSLLTLMKTKNNVSDMHYSNFFHSANYNELRLHQLPEINHS